MKILGIQPGRYSDDVGAIVELSGTEFKVLVNGEWYGKSQPRVGDVLDISDRFSALTELESKVKSSQKVGDSLRAMADAIDLVVQKAKEAITPPEELPSDGVIN